MKDQSTELSCGRDGEVLQLFPGLKAAVWLYGSNAYINVDTCFRFVPKINAFTTLKAVNDMWLRRNHRMIQSLGHEEKINNFVEYVLEQYEDESIITNYGRALQYRIYGFQADIDLTKDMVPCMRDGLKEEISIFDYFKQTYDITLKNKR